MRVLHVLDHSLPVPSGYSVRSHAILCEQLQRGWQVSVVTGPKQEGEKSDEYRLDDVLYRRIWPRSAGMATSGMRRQLADVLDLRHGLRKVVDELRPDILHVHSPCLNALAAMGLGIPVVYEMRSSWEDAAVSSGLTSEGSLRYRVSRALETIVLRRAAHVTTICNGLKADIVSRGVRASNVTVVPNAVDSGTLQAQLPDRALARANLGVESETLLGFVGSLFAWEGLDTAIQMLPLLAGRHPRVKLLIVGDGPVRPRLTRLAADLGVQEAVIFAGQVRRDQVLDAYAAIDLMVFPRLPMRLTEMVTPIKPLEAMALNRPVVASDVGGHKELVEQGRTGILFKAGSPEAMAIAVANAVDDPSRTAELVRAGRQYVLASRTWKQVVGGYSDVYARVANDARR